MRRSLLLASLVCLAACSGSSNGATDDDDLLAADPGSSELEDWALPDPGPADDPAGDPTPDPGRGEGEGDDLAPDPCAPGSAAFECPCQEHADCLSGYCVAHLGSQVCSRACEDDCPVGWECIQQGPPDYVFICTSRWTSLCRPCVDATACQGTAGAPAAVCVGYPGPNGEKGRFCGAACENDADCPTGYACRDATTWDGLSTRQCVAEDGDCPCSVEAVELATSTVCSLASAHGTCVGHRVCQEIGHEPTDCDAALPVPEACANGLDDDCDGATDKQDAACDFCVCGDGTCDTAACGECWNANTDPPCLTCAPDCAVCGNGTCDPGEGVGGPGKCLADCCGSCGDTHCRGGECGETPTSCPQDCGAGMACGNGTCDASENAVDCAQDCQLFTCGNHTCEPGEDVGTCPLDCGPTCGDCECDGAEDYGACPQDCGYCGDGYCLADCANLLAETLANCPLDCCKPQYCTPQCDDRQCGTDGCCGTCGTCGPGEDCQYGQCVCVPMPLPQGLDEVCNGIDDDCDGTTDEACGAAYSLGGYDLGGGAGTSTGQGRTLRGGVPGTQAAVQGGTDSTDGVYQVRVGPPTW